MSVKNINSVLDIADHFDAFCIDMYGVLWNGNAFYPLALSVLTQLKQLGKKIYILSNTTKPSEQMEDEMTSHGLVKGLNYDGYASSGSTLKHKIEHGFFEEISKKSDYKFYTIGGVPHTLFENIASHQTTDLAAADLVYFGSPALKNNLHEDFKRLLPEMKIALQLGKPAVLANPDYFAFSGGKKYARAGTMGLWYTENGGTVHWIGKPFPDIYKLVIEKINISPSKILMIGDTLRTDIAGGKNAGLKTLLITGTGITHDEIAQGLDLQTLYRLNGVTPDYTIESFE